MSQPHRWNIVFNYMREPMLFIRVNLYPRGNIIWWFPRKIKVTQAAFTAALEHYTVKRGDNA